jgi:hypothetical protein
MRTKTYDWKRYWIPQGENPIMQNGYFVEPSATDLHWYLPKSNGSSLAMLQEVPCLILLGDVGMGKSTVVEDEASKLSQMLNGQKHAVVYRDLKRLTEERIYREVFGHPQVQGWIRGEHALTLFLDSLDECWHRIYELESILVGELKEHLEMKKMPLFLRMTCRSAEWRGSVGEALKKLFPAEQAVQIHTLAPLSRENIRQAAAEMGRDGDDLLNRIAEKDAQPLASHPITFEMLFQIYLQGGALPESRCELYERGCLFLCKEPHSEFSAQVRRVTTPQQRLAAASRLAALSVLTNRYLVNGEPEQPMMRLDVLEASDVYGYFDEQVGGERVIVDRTTIAEVLQTALFSERAEGAQTWRHQSYAEFLAARYLAQCRMPKEPIVSLVTDTTDNVGRVIPQLEEMACWLADMKPSVLDALVAANVDTFIRCDPTSLDETNRSHYVNSYLNLIRIHETPELDWQLKHRFARLSYPNLGEQLGKVITDKKENPLVRESAIDIGGFCRCAAISDELMVVILDTQDVFRVRTHACVALENVADDSVRTALKKKAAGRNLDDSRDEIKGYYLKTLWPSHLSTSEVLSLLTPPEKRNYMGSYRVFLEYAFAKTIPDADIPQVLNWLRDKEVTFDILGPFGHLPSKILARALESMGSLQICEAIVGLLRKQGDRVRSFFRAGGEKLEMTADQRHKFWNTIAKADLEIQHLVTFGDVIPAGVLRAEDIGFFVDRCRAATTEMEKARWRELLFWIFDPNDSLALDLVSELAREDSATFQGLTARTSCPLVPDDQNWIKKDYERTQKRANAKTIKTDPVVPHLARINAALDAFGQGKTHAFWHLVEFLQCDPAKEDQWCSLNIRLSQEKGWKILPDALKQRILSAAARYFDVQEVTESDVWKSEQDHRLGPFTVANPAISLLFDEAKGTLDSFTTDQWCKWIPVVFNYHDWGNGSHEEAFSYILSLAFRKAETESLAALNRFIQLYIDHDNKRRIVMRLDAAWCPAIKAFLLDTINERALKPTTAQDLFQLFITCEPENARAYLEKLFEERKDRSAWSSLIPTVGAVLLVNWPEELGPSIVDVLTLDPPLGERIAWHLLRSGGRHANWIHKLPPHTTATFWDWLEKRFPGDPYDENDGGGSITAAHDMYHLRLGVLESLIRRGTREACAAMADLMRKRPNDFWLGNVLADMRKSARRLIWTRPEPKALMSAFADAEKRLIKTAGDLQLILIESIHKYEETLHEAQPSLELWNCVRDGDEMLWDPKDENNVSDCLKRHFERDLDQRGIFASREVQIRRRFGDDRAQHVDVFVAAIPLSEDGKPGKPVTVVVEVKCAWNQGVHEDMDRQLHARYLSNDTCDFGIYLVAYFTCAAWNRKGDDRVKSGASKMNVGDLRTQLAAQAKGLSTSEKRIDSIVIDARIGGSRI